MTNLLKTTVLPPLPRELAIKPARVEWFFSLLLDWLLPERLGEPFEPHLFAMRMQRLRSDLESMLAVLGYEEDDARRVSAIFFQDIVTLRAALQRQARRTAAESCEPRSVTSILRSSPEFRAEAAAAIAHELAKLHVPIIPTIVARRTERATGLAVAFGREPRISEQTPTPSTPIAL